ncbi:ECSIT [Acanthosepion pharaonis]|uniref:ECSIT n=1 Tax=Acanthosepion pharaonis TaxID=158019 RepID=A0A812E417_ACAPH|nr:ECSIT [Sepia pharaonis]
MKSLSTGRKTLKRIPRKYIYCKCTESFSTGFAGIAPNNFSPNSRRWLHKPDKIKYPKSEEPDEDEELFTWDVFTEEEKPKGLYIPPSIHEQSDGTVLAMCITGTASKDSLVMWIRALQRTNPKLKEIPVVFKLKTPETLPDIVEQENRTNLPAL